MLKGIPYFGLDNQNIWDSILNNSINIENDICIEEVNLYEYIINNIDNNLIVVINNKWLTWLNDIEFNYRDKKCEIPYFEYKTYKIPKENIRTNNKGHLILKDDTLDIRYEYKLCKIKVDLDNCRLLTYNLNNQEYRLVKFKNWTDDKFINLDKLYRLYIDSCFPQDDFIINKHSGGYHYITKTVDKFFNKEKYIRNELELLHFDNETDLLEIKDYRDVRNFNYNEVVKNQGVKDINIYDLYKIRRLKFEAYLYCCLRKDIDPDNDLYKKEWEKLRQGKTFIKYGDNIKLIFKSYWLNNCSEIKRKTWSRI